MHQIGDVVFFGSSDGSGDDGENRHIAKMMRSHGKCNGRLIKCARRKYNEVRFIRFINLQLRGSVRSARQNTNEHCIVMHSSSCHGTQKMLQQLPSSRSATSARTPPRHSGDTPLCTAVLHRHTLCSHNMYYYYNKNNTFLISIKFMKWKLNVKTTYQLNHLHRRRHRLHHYHNTVLFRSI